MSELLDKATLRSWLENNIEVWSDGFDEPGSRAALVSEATVAAWRTLLMRLDEGMFDAKESEVPA